MIFCVDRFAADSASAPADRTSFYVGIAMKKLVQTAARMVRCAISNELRKLRRKALEAEIDASFRRLEPRRVLTVNGAFDLGTGVLTVDITAGGNTTGVLQQDGADTTRFFLDENSNGVFDAADEVGGLKADLRGLVVNGPGGVGAFRWLDPNPTGSPVLYNLTSVTIGGVDTAQLQTLANVAANSTISVSNTIAFDAVATGSQLVFAGNLTLNASGPASQIISGANASLTVGGLADVTATTINLGDAAGDTIHFGSLAFTAAGNVQISEDSSMNLLSSSAAGDVTLSSTGDITIASLSGTDIFVTAAGNILDGDNPDPLVFDPDINASGDVSLTSTNGSIGSSTSNIFTADSISDNPDPLEMTRGPASTLTLNAVNGMIALDAANLGNVTTANTNALWIQSAADVDATNPAIAALIAGKANLALIADVDGDGTGNLTVPNPITVTGDLRLSGADVRVAPVDGTIVANALRFLFDSGESETLRTTVAQLDASSPFDLSVTETDDLQLVDLNNDAFNRAANAGGDLIIFLPNGSLTVSNIANASGNILLRTDAANTDITIDAQVESANGAITVQAQRSITQNAAGDLLISSGADQTLNTIYANAVTGSITMNANASSTTQGGNILYRADSRVTIGVLNAGTGGIWVEATAGDILDAQSDTVGVGANGFASQTGATRVVNLVASTAALQATAGSIGVAGNPLDSRLSHLASRSGSDTYVYQSIDLAIGSINPSSVISLQPDGSTSTVITAPLAGGTATNGNAKIETVQGDLIVDSAVNATGSILLAAGGANRDLTLNQQVNSTAGSITLLAQRTIVQNNLGDVATSGGTIYARAIDGSITMNRAGTDNAISSSSGGNIYYRAALNVTIGVLNAGTGGIWVEATAGDILDGQNDTVGVGANGFASQTGDTRVVNLIATTAALTAGGSVGLAANPLDTNIATLASASGTSTYIYESNALVIGSISASTVNGIHLDSSATPIATTALAGGTATNGNAKIETIDGSLTVDSSSVNNQVKAELNILLAAGGASSDVVVNEDVESNNGAITVLAQRSITQSATGHLLIKTGNGRETNTIYAFAVTGSITMDANALSTTQGGNIFYRAPGIAADLTRGNIALGQLDAKGNSALAGSVAVHAGNNISDNNDGLTINTLNVRATNLQLIATRGKIGDADLAAIANVNRNAIDTEVNTLAAASAQGIYVRELDGVTIDNTENIIVRHVNLDSSNNTLTILSREDLTTTAENGPIKLQSVNGDITVNPGADATLGISANGSGDVLLQTLTSGDITTNANIVSGTGDISVRSIGAVTQNANITTTAPGTVFVSAATNITMAGAAQISSSNGNVLLSAGSGDILLGVINAGATGNVSLTAGNSILDANSGALNVTANALRMVATAGRIGDADLANADSNANVNAIDTQINILAASSAQGIYVRELDGVTIDNTGDITVQQVNFKSNNENVTAASLEDLTTTAANGPIKLQSVDGNIIVNPGANALFGISANGSGDVLLQTLNSGTIITNAEVRSGTGNITLNSRGPLTLVDRLRTSSTGTIYVTSAGDVTVDYLVTGNVNLLITAGRDIVFNSSLAAGTINAGTARVYFEATRDIRDNNATNNVVNVTASALGLQAGGKIGDTDLAAASVDTNRNAIGTSVDTLAARSATGIYIQETNDVTIDAVTVAANQVNFNSTRTDRTRTLEDLTTTNNGPIKLQAVNGNTTVNPGTTGTLGISANGTGNILLQTVNSGSIAINAGVNSEQGAISLIARENITQSANGVLLITTGSNTTTNTIYAYAVTGSITMDANASSTTQGGNIYYRAPGNITLGTLTAGSGGVWLNAGGSILDAQNDTVQLGDAGFENATGGPRVVNVRAQTVVLQAGGTIGIEGNPIDTEVRTIAGSSTNGIFLRESNALVVGYVGESNVERVHFRSDTLPIVVDRRWGLTTTNGSIRVLTQESNLFIDGTINAGAQDITLIAQGGAIEQRPGTRMTLTSNAALGATTLNVADTSMFVVGMRIGISDLDSRQQIYTVTAIGAGTIQISGLTEAITAETSNLYQFHNLTSSAAAGANTVNVADSSAFSVGTRVAIWDADSAQRIYTVTAVGPGTIQLSSGLTQAIDAATSQLYPLQAQVVGSNLWLKARDHAHMHDVAADKLDAQTGANAKLDLHEQVNVNASQRGDDFLVDLETRIAGLVISDSVKRTYRFAEHYGDNGYSLYVVNDRTLAVHEVKAGEAGGINSPNVYIETLGTGNIHVNAPIKTFSSNADEGGIILVAGSDLKINDSGRLETFQAGGASFDQVVRYATLDSRFFRLIPTPDMTLTGAPGITTATDTYYTTRSILTTLQSAFATDNFAISGGPKHVYLEAAIQFGRANERGFENFIAYADGLYGMSHAANGTLTGTTALKSLINSTLYANNAVLPSALVSITETGWFVRQDPFNANFIRSDADGVFENFAVMRRANDFFMFQNASNSSGAQDLTVKTEQINVQRDALSPASDPPRSPDAPIVRAVATQVQAKLEEPLVRIDAMTLEFRNVFERQPNILLFRMNEFNDINSNGEPDPEDLPLEDEVLEKVRGNNQARKIAFPNDERGSTKPPVQPTQAEINRVKEALQHDPEAEVGVYSIIKEMPNGEKDVLDIFPIRDPDPLGDSDNLPNEERETIESIPTIPGQKPPGGVNDGAYFLPPRFLKDGGDPSGFSTRDENRGAAMANPTVSLAILLGAIGLRSNRSTTDAAPSATADDVEFARDARRQRRRESLLKTWSESQRRDS
jgi:hypothetical protein